MGLLEAAGKTILWRGVDYYDEKKVISCNKTGDTTYEGIVSGSDDNQYSVTIDTAQPKQSVCTCPYVAGRQIVCKHMVALYFTAFPDSIDEFHDQEEEWEDEEEAEDYVDYEELVAYVYRLSKQELRERLIETLIELEERDFF